MLVNQGFAPVPSPTGKSLTAAQLVDRVSWDFFDVLHVHTVELASAADLERLCEMARRRGIRLVLTVHDLHPNIETDEHAYWEKLRSVARQADAVLTLTAAAAAVLASRAGLDRGRVRVAPHGAPLPLDLITAATSGSRGSGGLAVYGALRPNRNMVGVVRAWQLLPAATRPGLRMLLRSVGSADEERSADQLAVLLSAADGERGFDLDVRADFLPAGDLLRWLAPAGALVLPYWPITHSGQLELACDLGLPVLAPEVRTLRAQLCHSRALAHPVTWYPATELEEPTRFSRRLVEVLHAPPVPSESRAAFFRHRTAERTLLLRLYRSVYSGGV